MKNTSTISSALLSTISDFGDLALLLGIPAKNLSAATGGAPRLYRQLRLDKRDGGQRIINAPSNELKIIQRSILDNILIWEPMSECAYGFGKGRTIVENARLHSRNPYLFTADIKDFFSSVHFTRVHKLFVALGSTEFAAKTLTRLAILNYCLPQGAPTSPYIATLALKNLDYRLSKLCAANRLTYSRYFDDLTISGGKRTHEIFETTATIVAEEGYRIHRDPAKLRFYGPREDKMVTGILIREGELCVPNIAEIREYIRLLRERGMASLRDENQLKEKLSLQGKIAFVSQVDSGIASELKKEFEQIAW